MPDGTILNGGDYISTQYKPFYGLELAAFGGLGTSPRLFDTAKVGNTTYGDPDLGSPNKKCPGGGVGVGKGGAPGENGDNPCQNCDYLGNVLIIQEDNGYEAQPDDNKDGGVMTFDFSPAVDEIYEISLLDIDYPVWITVVCLDEDGKKQEKPPIKVPLRGNNSLQSIVLNTKNVVQLLLTLKRSGAVSSLSFCYPPPGPSPTPATTLAPSPVVVPTSTPPTSVSTPTPGAAPTPGTVPSSPTPGSIISASPSSSPSESPTESPSEVPTKSPVEVSVPPTSIVIPTLTPPTPGSMPSVPTVGTPAPVSASPSSSPSESPSEEPSSSPVSKMPVTVPTLRPPTKVVSPTQLPLVPTPAASKPPSQVPPTNAGVCNAITVDFNEAANGADLPAGLYVENEWNAFGFKLSATGGVGKKPRLFDTANPGTARLGDPDLGSPNERCPGGGPGIGEGGEPDTIGANCSPLGNVLIIQERNNRLDIPDDNYKGGMIKFDFTSASNYVYSIGLLDVDYKTTIRITYKSDAGSTETKAIQVPILGDNSYQTVPIDTANVVKLVVDATRSGAVSSIRLCPSGTTTPTSVPATTAPPPKPTSSPQPPPTSGGGLKPTFIPSTQAPPTEAAGECELVTVDFARDADGNSLSPGQYVELEWESYGLVLASKNGFGNKPRIFDTSNPGTVEAGDPDLGSPNQKCNNSGPGVGIGGEPGSPGENCKPLGYALIVQENNAQMEIPDDNAKGGVLTFKFLQEGGTYVKEIEILDIDYRGARIITSFRNPGKGWRKKRFRVKNLGENSVQTVRIEQDNVRWLKLHLRESGAVPSIRFCR